MTQTYFSCPHCGAEVKVTAKACPECGSDESTGWSDGPQNLSLLPNDDDDYEDNLRREFGMGEKKPIMPSWVAITGFILLMLVALVFLL